MTKEEYEDFVLRYKGCGACFPLYLNLNYFEKKWFSVIQKDVAELEKQIIKMKNCQNCDNEGEDYYGNACCKINKSAWNCDSWEVKNDDYK